MINFLKRKRELPIIEQRSNVIQYDEMGYPLRLVILSNGEQIWVDTSEEDGDVVLIWRTK